MIITLKETAWSDGTAVSANDVVFAWKRLLDNTSSFEAACLLYDVKNAREAKESDVSIDDVCIYALNETQVEVEFVGKIDYDQFLLNLTSPALSPLREDVLAQTVDPMDWAKKPSILVTSGPFKLKQVSFEADDAGLILERNVYYFRDNLEDKLDKSVTPYRLVIDYTKTDEQIMQAYADGSLFFVGDIPLSVRGTWKDEAEINDALSTHTYVLNQDAVVKYYNENSFKSLSSDKVIYDTKLTEGKDGDKIFADANVRLALSKAINREEIVNKVVFAKAASGLVPYGVFNENTKKDLFREAGEELISAQSNITEARGLLDKADVDASKYMFAISVPAYDEVHMEIAKCVQAAWTELGFHVAINAINAIDNPAADIDKTTNATVSGVKDDVFTDAYYAKQFDVIAIDYCAKSATAFSVLAPFAKYYTGFATIHGEIATHISGYNDEEYNELIEKAFKETDPAARATVLHDAEKALMEDMPIIPIIFNQTATLASKEISKYSVDYYGAYNFSKLKLKDYEAYVPAEN